MNIEAKLKKEICEIARRLVQYHLLTYSGGNISVRLKDAMLITPRFSAERFFWELEPKLIRKLSLKDELERIPEDASRESFLHYEVLRAFPLIEALIHSHERNSLSFAVHGKSINLSGELKEALGETVPICQWAPSGTRELARNACETLMANFSKKSGEMAVLLHGHGILVGATSLAKCASLLCAISELAFAQAFAQLP
mgnify:CR=1 FL=1